MKKIEKRWMDSTPNGLWKRRHCLISLITNTRFNATFVRKSHWGIIFVISINLNLRSILLSHIALWPKKNCDLTESLFSTERVNFGVICLSEAIKKKRFEQLIFLSCWHFLRWTEKQKRQTDKTFCCNCCHHACLPRKVFLLSFSLSLSLSLSHTHFLTLPYLLSVIFSL